MRAAHSAAMEVALEAVVEEVTAGEAVPEKAAATSDEHVGILRGGVMSSVSAAAPERNANERTGESMPAGMGWIWMAGASMRTLLLAVCASLTECVSRIASTASGMPAVARSHAVTS